MSQKPPSPSGSASASAVDVAVLGLGNMGGAVLRGLLRHRVLPPERIGVCDLQPERVETFTNEGCRPLLPDDVAASPRILLAIKPQVFVRIAPDLSSDGTDRLAISVMAGLRSSRIARALGPGTRVVRTMPNTPASIGAGMTAISPGPDSTAADRAFVRAMFESVGTVVEIAEEHLYAVTAVSGSGPAWVFRKAEAWIDAAIAEGIPTPIARSLVVETLYGAAKLLKELDQDAASLREAVTSPGGTTAAGLKALEETSFEAAIHAAIRAATARGEELDRLDDPDQ
ncbi:MAG: pyrroline-5-carboxylate reductase [Planctomycetota bacterium]|nr:pyrroline-5-carboxylate reductase [Planctomycetota bacterium]